VIDVWRPTPSDKMIVKLPATVEMATPNVYADQIEWFSRHITARDSIVISVHPHNDRGTAVAAAELALMGGAERVEGTLFGNGERTGNVDVVTLALNLWSQGIDPGLDFSDIGAVRKMAERCTRLPVHPRHPYAGDLVFTAFSGSHQDAIRKGLEARRREGATLWEVPYLPIDPADLNRTYEAVIRVNSQSGKGGIAYVMEQEFGYVLPRRLQIEFSRVVQREADATGREIEPGRLLSLFETEYLAADRRCRLLDHGCRSLTTARSGGDVVRLQAKIAVDEEMLDISGTGNGPVDAFTKALEPHFGCMRIVDYQEHALTSGADAVAVAYVEVATPDGRSVFGVGRSANLTAASLCAILSALSRQRVSASRLAAAM
jgi:2-isopropylmalate synthase